MLPLYFIVYSLFIFYFIFYNFLYHFANSSTVTSFISFSFFRIPTEVKKLMRQMHDSVKESHATFIKVSRWLVKISEESRRNYNLQNLYTRLRFISNPKDEHIRKRTSKHTFREPIYIRTYVVS